MKGIALHNMTSILWCQPTASDWFTEGYKVLAPRPQFRTLLEGYPHFRSPCVVNWSLPVTSSHFNVFLCPIMPTYSLIPVIPKHFRETNRQQNHIGIFSLWNTDLTVFQERSENADATIGYWRDMGVAQSVKHLSSAQLMISGSWDWVWCQTPCLVGSLLLPLSLSATSPARARSISVE